MRTLWILLTFIFVTSCNNDTQTHANLISMVPSNTSVIVKATSIEGLKNVLKNNSLLSQFSDVTTFQKLDSKLRFLNHLKPSEDLLITFGKHNTDSLQVAVITKYHADLFNLDSVPNHSVETFTTDGNTLTKTTIDNAVVYSIIKDSIFFASNDRRLTEAAFEQRESNAALAEIYQTAGNGKSLSHQCV